MKEAGIVNWEGGPPDEERIDVVVGHTVGGWSHDNLSAWAHARGAKFVECMHSPATSPTRPENVEGFIALNHIARELNAGMPRARVIYGILDASSFAPYDPQAPLIGRLSRLADEKRPMEFVSLASVMRDLKFVIAGDGAMMSQVREQAPLNLHIEGWVRDFRSFYSRLRLFVFATRDECCCMSVAMAQAAGVPVICQDLPALRETTGGHAIFCHDLPSFYQAVRAHESDAQRLSELSVLGREWARMKFDKEVTVEAWDNYLSDL